MQKQLKLNLKKLAQKLNSNNLYLFEKRSYRNVTPLIFKKNANANIIALAILFFGFFNYVVCFK